MLRQFFILGFWLFAGLIALSFAGALHGAADSLAVFRHWWGAALAVCSLGLFFAMKRKLAMVGVVVAGVATGTVAMAYFGGNGEPGTYSVYQKNLLYLANSTNRIIGDVRRQRPDFVTLQEIAWGNRTLYRELASEHEAAHLCKFSSVGDVAVLSRWPMVEGATHCLGNQGAAAMKVVTPDGPVWLLSVHLHWPYPHNQSDQVDRLLSTMDFLDAPVVMAGDFNMVPWSHTVAAMERATGSKRAGPVVGTFDLLAAAAGPSPVQMLVPIDHILVPSGQGQLETRPMLGSDHLGLLLRFDL